MVDFPNAPIEGDTHTEEGQTWTYIDGAWIVGLNLANLLEIVESGLPGENWQVWGDTLIQWGNVNGSVTVITLPVPYANDQYTAVATAQSASGDGTGYFAQCHTYSTTEFTIRVKNQAGNTVSQTTRWLTIGEAPDDLKKPKGIPYGASGGGGGGASPWSIGDTFPASPSPGDTHYKTAGVVGGYIYYDDGTSSQWVQINSGVVGPEGPQGPQGEKGTVSTDPPSGGADGDVWYQVDP